MTHISSPNPDFTQGRPPIQIYELEGLTILSARLIVNEEGKDALVLDGDDGTNVVVSVRQEPGAAPFLEVSGENVLNASADDEIPD